MTPDPQPALERAYPYRAGWRVVACGVFVFGVLGAGGVALLPFGCEQAQQGRLPIGIALIVIGLFAAPMIVMATLALVMGVRQTVSPPLLRVTPTALRLPEQFRGEVPRGGPGDPEASAPSPQPDEVPFAAIRRVHRESNFNPGSDKLVIAHDLAPATLVIEQFMMRREDFDELETVLRAAVPAAFAPAPPAPPRATTRLRHPCSPSNPPNSCSPNPDPGGTSTSSS